MTERFKQLFFVVDSRGSNLRYSAQLSCARLLGLGGDPSRARPKGRAARRHFRLAIAGGCKPFWAHSIKLGARVICFAENQCLDSCTSAIARLEATGFVCDVRGSELRRRYSLPRYAKWRLGEVVVRDSALFAHFRDALDGFYCSEAASYKRHRGTGWRRCRRRQYAGTHIYVCF